MRRWIGMGLALGIVIGTASACRDEADALGGCLGAAEYFAPGCAMPPDDFVELPREGCYVPCDLADDACPAGRHCVEVWIDPCHDDVCQACGGSEALCLS